MKRRILWGVAFTLAIVGLENCALAQAAAESVLLKSGSAAATVKAGSALNSALDKGTKKLAGRVQQPVQPARGKAPQVEAQPVSTSPVEGTAAGEGTTPGQGPVIASIQGGETSCAPTAPTASTPESKTALESAQTESSRQDCTRKPAPEKYKSVITLSFSK